MYNSDLIIVDIFQVGMVEGTKKDKNKLWKNRIKVEGIIFYWNIQYNYLFINNDGAYSEHIFYNHCSAEFFLAIFEKKWLKNTIKV